MRQQHSADIAVEQATYALEQHLSFDKTATALRLYSECRTLAQGECCSARRFCCLAYDQHSSDDMTTHQMATARKDDVRAYD